MLLLLVCTSRQRLRRTIDDADAFPGVEDQQRVIFCPGLEPAGAQELREDAEECETVPGDRLLQDDGGHAQA